MSGKETSPLAVVTSDGFSSTTWSLVLAAGKAQDGGRALEQLCRKHWRPIYVFARKSGLTPQDAEDATQEFFIEFLEREWLKQVDPTRGRFRTFLLTLLEHFLSNRRRVSQAKRRGGKAVFLSLDEAEGERELASLADGLRDPSEAYEAAWWNDLIGSAFERLTAEQREAGKAVQFDVLRPFLTQKPAPGDYQKLGATLGMRQGQVALLVHRLNRRFAELIRGEVAETLSDRSDLEEELRFLRESCSR